jgi:hypothetical protein
MEMPTDDKLRLIVRVNKEEAAMSQLVCAMILWFIGGDPVSIHTLAAAAHDCFHWMVRHEGKESILRKWMSQQSKAFQKQISDAQNFFKHGHKWLKGEVEYPVIYGEMLMLDSLVCHGMLFDPTTTPAVLRLYGVRFGLENSDLFRTNLFRFFLEQEVIEELAPLDRQQFFERGLGLIGEKYPAFRSAHLKGSPPE